MASSPNILYPLTNWSGTNNKYFSESLTQIIQGDVPAVVSDILDGDVILTIEQRYKILRNGVTSDYTSFSTAGVTVGVTTSNTTSVPWSFNSYGIINLQQDDVLTLELKTVERRRINQALSYTVTESTVSTIIAEIVSEDAISESISIPTGVSIKRSQDSIKVLVPFESVASEQGKDFVGVNFYLSLNSGGGSAGYKLINDSYINTVDSSETVETVMGVSNYSDELEDLEITTTKTRIENKTYYTYTIDPSVLSLMVQEGKISNIFLSDNSTLDPNNIYYLVTTIVKYNSSSNQIIESNYSIEIEGKFLEYNVGFLGLPRRTRSDVLLSINKRLITNNSMVNVIGGSVIRDVLDPITLMFEKYYVVQDFVFKALSIDSLIAFDDSDGDGISDPLSQNVEKLRLADALGFTDEVSFQIFINQQFDKLASNYNLVRKGAQISRGTVTLFTSTVNSDILISDGTILTAPSDPDTGRSSITFRIVGTYIIEAESKEYYYNSSLKRYEVTVDIEATSAGSVGNVPAGTITVGNGLNPNLQLTNNAPTDFGVNRESNRDLANRIKLGIISYDSGTEGGYTKDSLEVPGVSEVRVEKVGDPLMMRDFYSTTNEHVGGKVDIYIKDNRSAQTVDQVAFKYEYPTDSLGANALERFDVTNASEYRIRCRNPKVGSNSPIVSVSEVRNVTKGESYDLTGIDIVGDFDTFVLQKNVSNLSIGMSAFDVITVNYKYRSDNLLKLTKQPFDRIISIVNSNNDVIREDLYQIVKKDDPLQTGLSNLADGGVEFIFTSTADFDEEFINVTDEQHNLYFNTDSSLSYKGVDISTLRVYNPTDTSIVYVKDVDYIVTVGNEINSTVIKLKTGSMIRQGELVSVNYTAAQNYFVTYVYNSIIDAVADKIKDTKHACADVAIKQAVGNYIDFNFQIIRQPGVNVSRLKSRIRTILSNLVNNLKMGETLTQSTVLSTIKSVSGVKDIIMPITKMMKRNGSFIPLDDLGTVSFEVYSKSNSLGIISYRSINSVLSYNTQEKGGPDNLFRTVYENNIALELVDDASKVSAGYGRAYIQANGKIIVSTLDGSPPHTKEYKAAYYVYYAGNESTSGDIQANQTEYLRVDSASLSGIDVIDTAVTKRGL